MSFYDQWSENPAENNAAPPYGAGERKMPFDQITDTFRVVMAAIKQLSAGTTGIIKSMATQDAGNVAITGGTIDSGVNIDARALKRDLVPLERLPTNLTGKNADGLTSAFLQTMYNRIYPIGRVMLWHTNNMTGTDLIWPGVTATWVIVTAAADYQIVVAGTKTNLLNGAGTFLPSNRTSGPAGAHDHGGYSGNVSLADVHMPAGVLFDIGAGGGGGGFGVGTMQPQKFRSGTGTPHAHPITGAPDHTHITLYDPLRFALQLIQRTA